jgi:protein transport protein SEC31
MASPWDFAQGGPRLGGTPNLEPNPWAGAAPGGIAGLAGLSPGGWNKAPQGPAPAGEPPWVTKARQARKAARQGPQMSTTETLPPGAAKGSQGPGSLAQMPAPRGEVFDPYGAGGAFEGQQRPGPGGGAMPPPTGPGPQPTPGVPPPLMGGIPRGGVMGGQGIPKMPQPPKLQRNPRVPPLTKAPLGPQDPGDIYGKTPGGGF